MHTKNCQTARATYLPNLRSVLLVFSML